MDGQIRLLQFVICKQFKQSQQDFYSAEQIHSNVYVSKFPYHFRNTYAITCWRKDERFHKEVLEYSTEYGTVKRSPHMDIEPVTNSVLFRWHKHLFPADLIVEKPTLLTVKVVLDWKVLFESYIMVEKGP